jgi:ATPase subunit of ABC transporter with duplicated ATPase domains
MCLNSTSSDERDHTTPLPIRAFRISRLNRLRKQLVEVEKNTRLLSRARGSQATKELLTFQRMVGEAERSTKEIDCKVEVDTKVIEAKIRAAVDLWTELQSQIECSDNEADVRKRAISILSALGFSEATRETRFQEISGGWQMRCHLAETLFQPSDIMILDEPTNSSICWASSGCSDFCSSLLRRPTMTGGS